MAIATTRLGLRLAPFRAGSVIWEDMCMKTGPLISPQLFRDFHLKPMKRVIDVFKQAGIRLIMLDSDGRVDELQTSSSWHDIVK